MNLLPSNSFSSSGVSSLWGVKRLSVAPPAEPVPACVPVPLIANKDPVVCPNAPPLPPVAATAAPKLLPNPPPLLAAEEKLNPDAEPPNPEEGVSLLAAGAAKEKPAAVGAEEEDEEEPNPDGGCVALAVALPKPVEPDWPAEEPNPPLGAAKLKLLALLS